MKLLNTKGARKLKQKLYYTDAYKKDFTTKIIKQDYDKDGNLYVVLNVIGILSDRWRTTI